MKTAEYNQIVTYLRDAEQSKYRYADIKARFEAEPAAVYGTSRASWIPDFAYAHQLLLESIALHLPPHGSALELGAGSGRVSKLLLETFPRRTSQCHAMRDRNYVQNDMVFVAFAA